MVTLTWEPPNFGPGAAEAPTKGEAEVLPASFSSSPLAFRRMIKRAHVHALSSLLECAHIFIPKSQVQRDAISLILMMHLHQADMLTKVCFRSFQGFAQK